MKKIFLLTCAVFLSAGIVSNAGALPTDIAIDFRSDAWYPANEEGAYSPLGSVAKAEAMWYSPVEPNQQAKLYQDSTDGLGVYNENSTIDYEGDEIETLEFLRISFNEGLGVELTGFWITDLFGPSDGIPSSNVGESGVAVVFWKEGFYPFFFNGSDDRGQDANSANGELYVDFGGAKIVTAALFMADDWLQYDDGVFRIAPIDAPIGNEFSVAGFTAAPIPEPATMILLGSGLLGIALVGRRRILK